MNARQIWEETSKVLEKVYDQREAGNISYLLLEDLFGVSRADIMLSSGLKIDRNTLERAVIRLLNEEPIQYVTGVTYFYGRKFKVGDKVLIPRPETEELVDLVIKEHQIANPKVLDVGVGSGCIAISLALRLKGEVYGVDVSKEAIRIAEWNAKNLGADVNFDLNDVIADPLPVNELDVLVSNPPYIPEWDRDKMHLNVLRYEPEVALFVPDNDPLKFYRVIGEKGREALKEGGRLYFEIHERYGLEVKELLFGLGYHQIKIHKDMQDKDRMVSAIN